MTLSFCRKDIARKGLKEPLFIGYQCHILGRILRVEMDSELREKQSFPNNEYTFIPDLVNNYEKLQANFNNSEKITESTVWRV
ncbi:Hypothetical predicted protein [Octopus vulgaris]|uniref:Uncharacterized protein n=1 Tax=Octopus vulgaris TaxID=6645 RepID=A0AA36FHB0_OCTVU|nr:Hypothetical predicted protein [Octopus vulgaris]